MKKILLLSFVLFSLYASAQPAGVRLNLYGGYVFDDHIGYYYTSQDFYDGEIQGGFQWGGGLEFETSPVTSVELLYIRQDTYAPLNYCYYSIYPSYTEFELDMNYLMLGGIRRMQKPGSPLEGYGGFMAGCFWGDAKDPETGSSNGATKFAWGIKLGANIWASEKVALKIQGMMLSPVQAAGGGIYYGTGGASAGVSTYSTVYQFTVGGGLAIKVGK